MLGVRQGHATLGCPVIQVDETQRLRIYRLYPAHFIIHQNFILHSASQPRGIGGVKAKGGPGIYVFNPLGGV